VESKRRQDMDCQYSENKKFRWAGHVERMEEKRNVEFWWENTSGNVRL
jgi:hypothetical protein